MSGPRHVDPELGVLEGEAASMDIEDLREPASPRHDVVPDVKNRPRDAAPVEGYYGLPVVKAPPWGWYVPTYFALGGIAGATSALAAVCQLAGDPALRALVLRGRRLALVSVAAGAVLLVADLGRPSRALAMVRMFRPTSALNVGGWVIGASGGALAIATFAPEKRAFPRALGDAAGLAGGASGLLLATYTGAVLSNTAIPVWRDMRRTLPFLFAASAASGAASALQLGDPPEPAAGVVRRLSTASKLAELVAAVAVERELGSGPSGRPLRTGRSGWLWTAGKALGAASLVASLASRRSRRAVLASGLLGTVAGVMVRFALHDAGIASGRDPRASL